MTATLREESDVDLLAGLCPTRPAAVADMPEGVSVRLVATPQDAAQVAAVLRYAHQRDLVVLPRGAGSKLFWLDPPPVVDLLLDLTALDHCRVDPETGTVTVGAGASYAVVQDELARVGRRLLLDPPSPRATIGGTLVTGETGPLAHLYGTPATQLTDATVVLPDGTVTTLADRIRLLGTSVCDLRWVHAGWPHPAGAVTEVTLRTHPLPAAAAWITCPLTQPRQAMQLRTTALAADLAPAAIELDLPGVRRTTLPTAPRTATGQFAVLLEGTPGSVDQRARALLRRVGADAHRSSQPPAWWGRYPFRADQVVIRLNSPGGELHPLCYALVDALGFLAPIRGSLGCGQAWTALPAELPAEQLLAALRALREVLLARGGSAVVQAAPSSLRGLVTAYRVP